MATNESAALAVALLGAGTIGADIAEGLRRGVVPGVTLVGAMTRGAQRRVEGVAMVHDRAALLALRPRLVVECAGADAFAEHVPALLEAGVDVIAVSMAAMARIDVEAAVERALAAGRATLGFASGAIGGLDALSAAREGGLDRVELIQRKPPAALLPPEQARTLTAPQVVQRASARVVALALPANSNVAAAAALAGLGFDRTGVTVIADPAVSRNSVELEVEGRFGMLRLVIENRPSPTNPKTSMTPAMSVLAALRRRTGALRIPA